MEALEEKLREVKQVIREHHGTNVADSAFARAVDELISVFYDDIGEIKNVAIRSLFDIFVTGVFPRSLHRRRARQRWRQGRPPAALAPLASSTSATTCRQARPAIV